jgi:hypothetical protein
MGTPLCSWQLPWEEDDSTSRRNPPSWYTAHQPPPSYTRSPPPKCCSPPFSPPPLPRRSGLTSHVTSRCCWYVGANGGGGGGQVVGGADGAGGFGGGLAVSVFDVRRRRWVAMKGPSGPVPPARHFHSAVVVRFRALPPAVAAPPLLSSPGESEAQGNGSNTDEEEEEEEGEEVWIYGGKSNGYHNDLATYALPPRHAWLRPPSPAPPPPGLLARYGHSAAAFGRRHLYVFGGYDQARQPSLCPLLPWKVSLSDAQTTLSRMGGRRQHGFVCDDVWRLSLPSLRWKKVDSARVEGLARYHHTAVVHGRSMFVWGGKSATCVFSSPSLHISFYPALFSSSSSMKASHRRTSCSHL